MTTCGKGLTIIKEADVENLLTWPAVFEACAEALRAVSEGKEDADQPSAKQPIRTYVEMTKKNALGFSMLGFIENYRMKTVDPDKVFSTFGHKLATSFPHNKDLKEPLPVIIASIFLFSTCTGQLQTIIEGNGVTAWRTAGACMVATKYLYFDRNEQHKGDKVLAIVGCGVQGRIHAIGISSLFGINEIHLWNRSVSTANDLKKELEGMTASFVNKNLKVFVHESVRDCVKTADIIVTATGARSPILFEDMLKENVHINAVGASKDHHSEIDLKVYQSSKLYADSMTGAKSELKGLDCPVEGAVGDVINKTKSVPKHPRTVFHSLGMSITDCTVAQVVETLYLKKHQKQ
ncbi:hypothetical protein HA402_005478 [Bradysia odoriphaga]|nr:hypothetical protein HA402_005478 [Bradysia odoriphaga]